jgi:CheY-like chemotaxis protein
MSGPCVLIVDDSEDDVLLASAYIRRWIRDVRFKRVDSACELESALAAQHWDLVLCDHNMPGFDSTRALELVRNARADLPFFVYSGEFSRSQTADALKGGADGVLEKRDTPGLLRVIGNALGKGHAVPAATHAQSIAG